MTLKTSTRALGFDKTTSFDLEVEELNTSDCLLNVVAGPKAGKTRLLLEKSIYPLAYLNTDKSEEGAIQRALAAGRKIAPARYFYKSVNDTSPERIKARAMDALKKWRHDYLAAINNPKIRCIGIDGGSSVNEMVKLAYFGGMKPPKGNVAQFLYAEVNRRMSSIILAGKNCGKSVVWVHRPKELYRANKPTGILVARGFEEVAFEAQATVFLSKGAEGFSAEIKESRFNPNAIGVELTDEDITLKNIIDQVFNAEPQEKDEDDEDDKTKEDEDDADDEEESDDDEDDE